MADIIKIKLRFDEIDIDQTGEIDYNEFLDDISETRSPFVDAVFSLVDVNGVLTWTSGSTYRFSVYTVPTTRRNFDFCM